jgi:hypothetical protein
VSIIRIHRSNSPHNELCKPLLRNRISRFRRQCQSQVVYTSCCRYINMHHGRFRRDLDRRLSQRSGLWNLHWRRPRIGSRLLVVPRGWWRRGDLLPLRGGLCWKGVFELRFARFLEMLVDLRILDTLTIATNYQTFHIGDKRGFCVQADS